MLNSFELSTLVKNLVSKHYETPAEFSRKNLRRLDFNVEFITAHVDNCNM